MKIREANLSEKLVLLIAALLFANAVGFLIIALIEFVRSVWFVVTHDLSKLCDGEFNRFYLEHTALKSFKHFWISAASFVLPLYLLHGPKSFVMVPIFFVLLSFWLYEKRGIEKIKAEVNRDQKPPSDS
ncbi:MAG: hypothetical protein Q7R94_01345 [bacterium]|nr:hypothetical protein [bacterium]